MSKYCAACGAANPRSTIGGTLLCEVCRPKILAQADQLRAEGKPVDVSRLATAMFRAENSVGSYLLRDIPADLWHQAKHVAVDRGTSLRELLIASLRDYLSKEE